MKNILVYIFAASSLALTCCGQGDKKVKEAPPVPPRQELPFPKEPLGRVSDFEKVFTTEQINYLDSILAEEERKTTNEVALVTLSLDSTQRDNAIYLNNMALSLFTTWGVGKKGKDNGVGILVVPNLKKIRIEVGYGLEEKLTNEELQDIINSFFIPEFKKGDYYAGVLNGIQAIIREIK